MRPRVTAWILAGLSLVLLAYAGARACLVPITYDEAYTFLNHVRKAVFYQQAYDQMGGNHHLLNVWCTWASWSLFGDGTFALRLPSLLAGVLYMYCAARLSLRSGNAVLAVAVFLVLVAHPYLVDFFSLARGYALACAFMLASLWQAHRYWSDSRTTGTIAAATAFASLAAMSHVIMVNYLLAFGLVMFIMALARKGTVRGWKEHVLVLAVLAVAGLAVILPNALGLFQGGSLNFGCEELWACTVRSLAEKVLYHHPYGDGPLVIARKALIFLGLVGAVGAWIAWRRKELSEQVPVLFAVLVPVVCLVSFLAQNILFGVPLPTTRTALFLLPLAAWVLAVVLVQWSGPRWAAATVALAASWPLLTNLGHAVNTTHCIEWRATGDLTKALAILEGDRQPLTRERPLVNLSSSFEPSGCVPYYVATRPWRWLADTQRPPDGAFPRSDYYLVGWNDHDRVDTVNWTKLFHSVNSGLALFRDERMRRNGHTVVHHDRASADGSWKGSTPVLTWTVPPDHPGAPLVITATVRAYERSDLNWLGITLQVVRNDSVMEIGGQPSHPQIDRYGEWNAVSAELMPSLPLRSGDEVRCFATQRVQDPPIAAGSIDMWVLR